MSEVLAGNNLTVIGGTLGSVAVLTTGGRLFIQYRKSTLSRLDSIFNSLACLTLVAFLASDKATPQETRESISQWEAFNVAVFMLFWITLYLVKASFLALCWSIFKISPKFRLAWRLIAVYTFITFWPIFLSTLWRCGRPSQIADSQACLNAIFDDFAQQWLVRISAVNVSLHISSDCLILALPTVMVWKLHLAKDQKIGIIAVFAVTIIDIILGIMRNIAFLTEGLPSVESNTLGSNDVISELLLICEPCIAVVVCATPAYRVLLPSVRKQTKRATKLQRNAASPGQATSNKSDQTLGTEIELVIKHETVSVV